MQPKLKNHYFIFTGYTDLGEPLCVQFHKYPNTENHYSIGMPYKYALKDFSVLEDGYSLVSIFLATKPELQRCYKYFQKNYPLLVDGLKVNTHPAKRKIFKQILNDSYNWQEHNTIN